MALAESQLPRRRSPGAWRLANDDVLARAAARGDRSAFEALFSRHHPALLRYCRSLLLDADAAQDAAQSAFAAALRALGGTGPQPVVVKAWLFKIAHNEAMTLLRARSADANSVPVGGVLERVGVQAAADDPVRERLHELVADLRVLPERQRAALLMRELSGLAYDEIAAALGTSEGAARQAVCDARAGLQDMGGGRAAACAAVRRTISDDDRRVLRGRGVRAHLAGCAPCAGFARQIRRRRQDLRILVPAGPALAFALFTGGGAAGGGAAGGGLAFGLGASSAAKCVAVCASAAMVGVGGVGALTDGPEPGRVEAERPRVAVAAPAASGGRPVASSRPPAVRIAGSRIDDGAGGRRRRPATAVAVAVVDESGAARRLPARPGASRPAAEDEAEGPEAGVTPPGTTPGASVQESEEAGAPGAEPPGAQATGDVGSGAAGPSPTAARTASSPSVALALADARAQIDAALAAARQTIEQQRSGTSATQTQTAPSVADALVLLDTILRRG